MFHTSPVHLPHPHFGEPDHADLDAEECLARISRMLTEVGLRNDALRERLRQGERMLANLIEIAETTSDT